MQIKYVSCDGSTVTEPIVKVEITEVHKIELIEAYCEAVDCYITVLECTRLNGDTLEVEAENVKHIKTDGKFRCKEREILQAIRDACNACDQVTFSADWGGNSLIIHSDDKHTHCGFPEATYDQLINDLHDVLVEGRGLSWERG